MRLFLALAAVALLVGSAAECRTPQRAGKARPAASLPVFSFMGDDTETVTMRTKLNDEVCSTEGEILKCTDYSISHLAGAPILFMSLSYNKGLLFRVIGTTNYTRFSTLLEAFTVKYGKPSLSSQKWQSRSGATFDNSVARWFFRDGMLTLESRGTAADEPMFTFVSTKNAPPAEKPKIDF